MTEKEKYIGQSKLSGKPEKPLNFKLGENCVKTRHIADDAVTTPKIKDKAVTPEKVSDDFHDALTGDIDKKFNTITDSLDQKYKNITDELYSMIASLQVGGIALSQQFGDRTDIGISQKTLTKALGRFWQEIETITGKTYMDYTLTIQPTSFISEGSSTVTVTADCSEAISDFDSIKVYLNGELKAESSDISVFTTTLTIDSTSLIRVEGTILGKMIAKEQTVSKLYPFFMGSGQQYTDVLVPECQKEMHGSLQGDYEVVVNNNGEYIFLIIPISHKDEFRRAKFDMNGFEIPLEVSETPDFIICKTLNTYRAGTYNIDIDIND